MADRHDTFHRLATREELGLGQERHTPGLTSTLLATLASGFEPGRALDRLDLVVGRAALGSRARVALLGVPPSAPAAGALTATL
jgi:hypothetical protein